MNNNIESLKQVGISEKEMKSLTEYDAYIAYLLKKQAKNNYSTLIKRKESRKELSLQKHHIVPRFAGGAEDVDNIVICTIEDHATAHEIRFCVYSSYWDKAAYHFIRCQNKEGREARQRAIVKKNRSNKTGFFDPKIQKKLSLRPKKLYYLRQHPELAKEFSKRAAAKVGSRVYTEKARENCRQLGIRVGTQFGRKGGLKHQNPITTMKIKSALLWCHKSKVTVKTNNMEALVDIQKILNEKVHNSVKHTSGLSELLRSKSPTRYGWSVKDID